MEGYTNLLEATGDGRYATGELMRRDENGLYFFVGRADDMFASSGESLHPGEIGNHARTASRRAPGKHHSALRRGAQTDFGAQNLAIPFAQFARFVGLENDVGELDR